MPYPGVRVAEIEITYAELRDDDIAVSRKISIFMSSISSELKSFKPTAINTLDKENTLTFINCYVQTWMVTSVVINHF